MNNRRKAIRVGFIMQCPDAWDKMQPVFEQMIKDDRFLPCGAVVPGYEGYDIGKRPFGDWGDEWTYFHSLYPEHVIDAVDEHINILDMREMHFDYVFYQRPYEVLLPALLRAEYVKNFSKICYIPYGAVGAKVFEEFALNNANFFSSADLYFAPSAHLRDLVSARFSRMEAVFLGYPSFEEFFMNADKPLPIRKYKKILWTPRWSYDPIIGGSHFLEYREKIIQFRQSHSRQAMMIRPHPLMQGELISKGFISEEEWKCYTDTLANNDIVLDKEKTVDAALLDADILLTDFSTIIPMFFVLNKPVIYCPADNIELNADYKRLLPGMYSADNWEDIEVLLKFLSQGMDIKKLQRLEIINELKQEHIGAVGRILDYLAERMEK